jgi:predicted transcriptional regulator
MSIFRTCDDVLRYLNNLKSHEIVDKEEIFKNVNATDKELDDAISILRSRDFIKGYKPNYLKITRKGIEFVSISSFEIESQKNNFEFEKLKGEVELLQNKMFDYDETKSRSKRSEKVAIGGLLLSAIALLMQWICNKPG